MNLKKVLPLVVGGMLTVSALGLGADMAVAKAAEHDYQHGQQQMQQAVMKDGKQMMDPKIMQDMMKDPAMQKQCEDMMQKPEMQAMMNEMMQKDGQFHKPTTPQVKVENRDHMELH